MSLATSWRGRHILGEQRVLVTAGGAQFFVEVSDGGGPTTISDRGPLSFEGVRETIAGIASELAQVWDTVRPTEASVEFGLKLSAKSGKLTGLLVEGGGEASLTVSLTWARQAAGGPSGDGRTDDGPDEDESDDGGS